MVDHTEDPKILELYDEGKELREIAQVVGFSEVSVHRVLIKHGRSPWDRRYPNARSRDDEQMIQDYKDGVPVLEIFEKHKVSQTHFYRILKENNIPLRPRKGNVGKENYQYKHGKGNRSKERDRILKKQVAALCLGYVVPRRWIIHHMDENPANNNPENLAIFHNKKEHAVYHQRLLKSQREGHPVDASQLVSESGGFLLPLPTHPIVLPHERDRLFPLKYQQKPKENQEESEQESDESVQQ